jgi:hypothetical protein
VCFIMLYCVWVHHNQVAKTLRRVDILKSLNLQQLQQLCDVFTDVEFNVGE